MKSKLELYRRQLAKKGYKWTSQREQVLLALLDCNDSHVSAEELHGFLQARNRDIGLATVYRTLDILAEVGIAHRLQFGDGCSRYELSDDPHHHHHLICNHCNRVWEVPIDLLENLEQKIEQEYNFTILGHHLKFFGLCARCREKLREGK